MARPIRIQFPDALYHVISRGNEKKPIVRDDVDRHKRIDWLRRTVETHGWRLHAFVLMTNHEHLFVETPEPNLSAGMQYLNGSYTSYFNRRHRRAGHLFQGRFKGHLIEEQGYFLEVSRYIHLNPVRAKIVDRPEQYEFSSYCGYTRSSQSVEWICYERVLGEFSPEPATARRAYGRFVRAGVSERPPSPFRGALGGMLVGSEKFVARIGRFLAHRPADPSVPQLVKLRSRPTLAEIIQRTADHFGSNPRDWRPGRRVDDAGRAAAAYLARRRFGYTVGEVASSLGYRGHGSVSTAISRIESSAAKLKRSLAKLEQTLTNV